MNRPLLIVITGATASGKSALAVDLASRLGCDIISADSRQIYRDIPIGTAAPSAEELATVHHHFVGMLGLDEYYSAARFEEDVMNLLPKLWRKNDVAVMCGGSMMYVDAVTDGIDNLPTITDSVRNRVKTMLADLGLDAVMAMLRVLDPTYADEVDPANTKRVVHALEICLQSGRPYSELRQGERKQRPFDIVKVAIDLPREQLFDRINRRVDAMVDAGLLDEARRVYPLRHLNSLNTVGYKELFAYFDGTMDLDTAIARIAKNTRVYAKKQLTWLARPSVRPTTFLSPTTAAEQVLDIILYKFTDYKKFPSVIP